MQRHYYAMYCPDGYTRCKHNHVGAEVMQFCSLQERAEMVARINNAHAGTTACAAWPIGAKDAACYVSLRNFFDNSHEVVAFDSYGNVDFFYRSQLITH